MNSMNKSIILNEVLPDGTYVRQDLCREFRRQVESAVEWLPSEVTCDIGDLVTPRLWLPLDKRHRSKLGRFLAHWVVKGELPLEFASPPHRPNKRYRLRG